MKRTLLTLFAALAVLPALADEGHVASEPHLGAHRRHALERIPPHGRRHLFDQPGLDEGRRSALRRRLHGRAWSRPKGCCSPTTTAATTPSSATRPSSTTTSRTDSGPCRGPKSLPNEGLNVRFLVRMEEVTDRLKAGETAEEIVRRAEAEGKGFKGLGRADVLRQPAVPVRLPPVRRRAPGGRAALVDRQVRRRHRQLDLAPPHGRLLRLPDLRLEGQRTGGLLARQRSLPPRKVLHRLGRRRRRGRLHDDLRIPGQHAGVHPLGRRALHRRALRPGEDRHPHGPSRPDPRGPAVRPPNCASTTPPSRPR